MTRTPKTPAMPLYGKDAYDDEWFRSLSLGAQGLFWRLAWWQWSEGSIPEDISEILDGIPRKQATDARKAWAELVGSFPVDGSRRRSASVERRREDRLKNKSGADVTNEKRWDSDKKSDRYSDNKKASDSESLRAASANAIATANGFGVGVQGKGLADLVSACAAIGWRVAPPEQIVASWAEQYGAASVLESIASARDSLDGKHYNYLTSILADRRKNPSERPRKPNHDTAGKPKPSAKDFGMRSAADVLSAKRDV